MTATETTDLATIGGLSEAARRGTLPVTMSVPDAGRLFGYGRAGAYAAAKDGRFPLPVISLGRRMVVATADVLRLLHIDEHAA